VSLREGKLLQTVASTSDLTKRVNAIEHELDEGPCRQALLDHRSYRIDDMSTDNGGPGLPRPPTLAVFGRCSDTRSSPATAPWGR
jgi:hypothetical protein